MQVPLKPARLRDKDEIHTQGGFTLVELLIIVVILGILASIVVFAVQNLAQKSANSVCQSDFKTVETASEAFKVQVGSYPAAISDLTGTRTVDGNTVGPWLKDAPSSSKYGLSIGSPVDTTGSAGGYQAGVIVITTGSGPGVSVPAAAAVGSPGAGNSTPAGACINV